MSGTHEIDAKVNEPVAEVVKEVVDKTFIFNKVRHMLYDMLTSEEETISEDKNPTKHCGVQISGAPYKKRRTGKKSNHLKTRQTA